MTTATRRSGLIIPRTARAPLTARGIVLPREYRNKLTNGDIEDLLSGTVNGFVDTFADLNAWTTVSGSPSVALNLVTLAANAETKAGHTEWWDFAAGTQFRFQWATGGTARLVLHWVDAQNYTFLAADGANFWLGKVVANVTTVPIGGFQAAVLTNGNFYWFNPVISSTTYSATLVADNAGANTGATVATITAQTISDAAVATGQIALWALGATIVWGGAFSNVCRVVIPAPPGWAVNVASGVPAFCVSKTTKFGGTYSLSIYANHTGVNGDWRQSYASALATQTVSGRIKTNTTGTGWASLFGDVLIGTSETSAPAAIADWTVEAKAFAGAAGAKNMTCRLQGTTGTAWFDLLWLAQQAYDTGQRRYNTIRSGWR